MANSLEEVAPELARALRAVYRVSRADGTAPQRAAASRAADRWTVLANNAGWTRAEIARATGIHPSAIDGRVQRQRRREPQMPELRGLLGPPGPPLSERAEAEQHRRRLIGPAGVAQLVGCQPASVTSWAAARGVPYEWTPGRAKRLYDPATVLEAAAGKPLEQHPNWRRRKNIAVPPQSRTPGASPVRSTSTGTDNVKHLQ